MSATHNEQHKEQHQREVAAKTMKDLQEGKLPNNDNIVRGIDSFGKKMDEAKPNLSHTGQEASKKVANILETTKELLETKNENEHLQKAVYHMYHAGKNQPMSARFSKLKDLIFIPNEDVKGLQSQARQHIDSLVTIVKLCIMSPEFRQTLNQFFKFFSSLLHKSSKKLEDKYHNSGVAAGDHVATGVIDKSSIHTNEAAIKSSLESHFQPNQNYQWVEKEGNYSLKRNASEHNSEITQDKEEKLVNLVTDLLQRIHSYPEFSNAVDFLSDSLTTLQANWRENIQKLGDVVEVPPSASSKSHRQASKRELIEFIENWIGEDYSLDPLIHSVLQIRDIVQHDPELRQLFHDLRTFFTKSAKDSTYVNDKERVRHDARDLIRRTRNQLRNKHREEFQRLKREVLFINTSLQNDDTMIKLRDEVKDLVRTLTTDQNGNPTIKPELLSDAQVLVQALFDTIKYLPLPPVEKEDENGTFRLDNVVINCTDILPSQIHLSTTLDATGGKNHNSIEIRMSHIRAHLRNVKFYIDKRSGFPHIKESGLVDVDLAGKRGLDLFISVRPQLSNSDGVVKELFTINECTCSISKLKLRLRDTKHDGLYKFLSPVINAIARKRIETLVQDQIKKAINMLDRTTVSAVNKAKVNAEKVKEKAEDSHYVDNSHKAGKSHKTTDHTAHGTHAKSAHGAHDKSAHGAHDKSAHGAHDKSAHATHDKSAHAAHDKSAHAAHDKSAHAAHDKSAHGAHDKSAHGAHEKSAHKVDDHSATHATSSKTH